MGYKKRMNIYQNEPNLGISIRSNGHSAMIHLPSWWVSKRSDLQSSWLPFSTANVKHNQKKRRPCCFLLQQRWNTTLSLTQIVFARPPVLCCLFVCSFIPAKLTSLLNDLCLFASSLSVELSCVLATLTSPASFLILCLRLGADFPFHQAY